MIVNINLFIGSSSKIHLKKSNKDRNMNNIEDLQSRRTYNTIL
jgi:hypothetical protein